VLSPGRKAGQKIESFGDLLPLAALERTPGRLPPPRKSVLEEKGLLTDTGGFL